MKYSLVLFSLVVLNTISCNQENIVNGQINSQEPKMIHMPLNKALPYTEINFSNVKIIPLESNDNYMLGDIAKVYFRNNRFFVRPHNGDIIFIFDRAGKGLGRLDATGDGPGEYGHMGNFDILSDKEEIVVSDVANRKIIHYSFDGELIKEFPVDFGMRFFKLGKLGGPGDDYTYIVDAANMVSEEKDQSFRNFHIYSKDMELLASYIPFEKRSSGIFGSFYHFFNTLEDTVGYYKPWSDSIFRVEGLKLQPIYTLDFGAPIASKIGDVMSNSNEKYVFDIVYLEDKERIYLRYLYDGAGYLSYYHKSKGKSTTYMNPREVRCIRPLSTYGNNVILEGDYYKIPCLKKLLGNCESFPIIEKELDKIGEDDNNFLIIAQIMD